MSKKKAGQTRRWRWLFLLLIPVCGCMLIPFLLISYINASGPRIARTMLPVPPQSIHVAGTTSSNLTYDIQHDLYIIPLPLEETKTWFARYIRLSETNDHYVSTWDLFEFSNEYLIFMMSGNLTRRIPGITSKYDEMPTCFSLKFGEPVESMNLAEFKLTDEVRKSLEGHIIALVSTCYANW